MSRRRFARAFCPAHFPRLAALALVLAVGTAPAARAFELMGSSWPDGDIPMILALGNPGQPLLDGSADFSAVAESALQVWNQHLARSRFTSRRDLDAPRGSNGTNNVFFALDVYGMSFPTHTAAITLISFSPTNGRVRETDVIFNSNSINSSKWDSYRGALRPGMMDFRRVAIHEFGHVLGLLHPDESEPPQNVSAIMDSVVGNIDNLEADDVAGARALYEASSGVAPRIAAQPAGANVSVGQSFTLSVAATASNALPLVYDWFFTPAGTNTPEPFRLATGPTYTIGSVQLADAGRYTANVRTAASDAVVSSAATLNVTPIATTADTTLANISTRAFVGTGNNVMIAGLVVGGTTPKSIFVRAVGPALTGFGVGGALADPALRLVNSAGLTVAENDNWENQASTGGSSATISAAAQRLGAFAFSPASRDSALLVPALPPGSYTAIVSGVNNSSGIALVEAYDADPDAATARTRKLVNIATRGQVNRGDDVLIAGLVVAGPGPRTYLIRAIGPTLRFQFGLDSALLDPFLQIYQGNKLLRENDDWDSPESAMPALRDAAQKVGAFAMMPVRDERTNSGLDAAMLITLQPGSYTAKVTGFEGATGVALIEIYEVP